MVSSPVLQAEAAKTNVTTKEKSNRFIGRVF